MIGAAPCAGQIKVILNRREPTDNRAREMKRTSPGPMKPCRPPGSIGIAVRRWISYHDFVLNIDNNLSVFNASIPCGLSDATMTSMNRELGRPVDKNGAAEALICHFGDIFQRPLFGNYDDNPSTTQT